jgi:hypothetical protein
MKMKKFSFYALLAGAIFFTYACDKDVTSTNLQVDLASTTTVHGYVYADMDRTKAGLEAAPSDKAILIFSVSYSDFDATLNTNGKWKDTVHINADGHFTANVPVTDKTVTLKIDPQPFEAEQTYFDGTSLDAKIWKIYSAPTTSVPLSTSINQIVEIAYNNAGYSDKVDMVTLTLTIEAELDNTQVGSEPVKAQKVILSANGWAEEFTTSDIGEIVASVPNGEVVYMNTNFNYNKKLINGTQNTNYKKENSPIGTFLVSTSTTVDLGSGTAVTK